MAPPSSRVFAIALLLLAGGPAAIPQPGSQPPDEERERAREAGPESSAEGAGEEARPQGVIVLIPGWTPGEDPRSFPLGLTVLGPSSKRQSHASEYPAGVTVLDNRARNDSAPIVRVSIDEPTGSVVVTVSDAIEGGAEGAGAERRDDAERTEVRTDGPTIVDQIKALGQGPLAAGGALGDRAVWIPVSALEPRDPGRPYPWQPVEWQKSIIDPVWIPVSAWPERISDRPYPWNPAEWTRWIIEPGWLPQDSWGRTLGITFVDTGQAAAPDIDRLAETAESGKEAPPGEQAVEGAGEEAVPER